MKHIIYILLFLISLLPMYVLFMISKIMNLSNKLFFHYRYSIALNNIKTSFPNLKSSQCKEIFQSFYNHFFNIILETIKSLSINKESIIKRVKINDLTKLKSSIKNKKNIVILCAHYGNWEWLFLRLSLINNVNINAIYQQLSNKYFNEIIIKIRTKFGGQIVSSDKWKQLLLKHKNRGTYLFVADQVPQNDINGKRFNFLNKSTLFHVSPEKTAKLLEAEVYYAEMQNKKTGYYNVNLIKLSSKNVTKEYTKLLEKTIKNKPQYWLWSHNRWKR